MKSRLWKLLKTLFKLSVMIIIVAMAGVFFYCWRQSEDIEKRFAGRRWSIPSKVYSDITLLYPGQRLNRPFFHRKLKDLGYREFSRQPVTKGQVRILNSVVEIYLHDLDIPFQQRKGFPVQIRFKRDRIQSIRHLETGKPLALLTIEPEEIMSFFGPEREQRELVSIEQVPPWLINAVLAAEDSRFYGHHGVDPRGILRAIAVNLRHGEIRQGGSTLTQQLAKNYFLTSERTFTRKFNEMLIALVLEYQYEKNQILEIYLNEIYFGQKGSVSINGIGEAARYYFGKPVEKLSISESAAIAGLIKAPNYYSPYKNPERCLERRNFVLNTMHKKGWLSDQEFQKAVMPPVTPVGYTLYGKKGPYFIDYLSDQLAELYSQEALSSLGLSIYTTLDTQVQTAAEKALERGLARLEKSIPALQRAQNDKKLQGALIVMQPKTGAILAMVGGRDYNYSQFNRVTQARRQPGSVFKPFVYLTGLEYLNPVSVLSNEPRTFDIDGKRWQPRNFEPDAPSQTTLRTALAKSYNLATIDLAMKVGLDKIADTARNFHFSTPIRNYPSMVLGSFEVIPLDIARAYCAFAADGVLPYALSLKKVTDENREILERRHMNIESLMSPAKAFLMTSLLQSVVTEGTARSLRARGITFPVAGKTGTTNDSRDAWFVGYTPDILALVWVGFDNGDTLYTTGSGAALPIWADLMKMIPQYISENAFHIPPGIVQCRICSDSGYPATQGACPHIAEEYFLEDNLPVGKCPLHDPVVNVPDRSSRPRAFERLFRRMKTFAK